MDNTNGGGGVAARFTSNTFSQTVYSSCMKKKYANTIQEYNI